jgi:hypothetical protein
MFFTTGYTALANDGLINEKNWACGWNAPGGGIMVNVDKGYICDYGMPTQCDDPQYSQRYAIRKTWKGTVKSGDRDVPFVEYAGRSAKSFLSIRIYIYEVSSESGPSFHADLLPSGNFTDDITSPIVSDSELGCVAVKPE